MSKLRLLTPAGQERVRWLPRPGERRRQWWTGNAHYCLPMETANAAGWTVNAPFAFAAMWTGGPRREDVVVMSPDPNRVRSALGRGFLTILLDWVPRTDEGVNLLVMPVPNLWKPGVQWMSAMVEADQLMATMAISARIWMPNVWHRFEAGEPLVQLMPYPRHYVDQVQPEIVHDAESSRKIAAWQEIRTANLAKDPPGYDYLYRRGEDAEGCPYADHQKSVRVREFEETPQEVLV